MVRKLHFLKESWDLWYEKDSSHVAASVSYYSLFGLVPFVFLTFLLTGWLFGREAVELRFVDWGSILGPEVVSLLAQAITNLEARADQFIAPVLGALFFSGMVIVMLNAFSSGLMEIWGIKHRGWRGWLNKSLRAVLFVGILQAYVLMMLVLKYFALGLKIFISPVLVGSVSAAASFILLAFLLSLAYGILTWESPSWRARWCGALVASVLFLVGKSLVSVYVSVTPFPGLYGATGLLVVLLMWVYAAVSIFYYGAAVAKVLDNR